MALLAVGSQLPFVNVRVAILAALADTGEHRLHMALRAGDGLVHPAERILRLVVIEFRNSADGCPRAWRVTVLTWNGQISVRTMRPGNLRRGGTRQSRKRPQGHCNKVEYAPSPRHVFPLALLFPERQ